MHHIATTVLALHFALLAPAEDDAVGDQPAPAEQLRALADEFGAAARGLYEAKDDEDRKRAAERGFNVAPRFLELAKEHPNDAVALDALVQAANAEIWLENNTQHPGWGKENPLSPALAILLRDHLHNEKLGLACWRVSFGFRGDCETFLRTVLKESPHKSVQGAACLRLAQYLNARWQRMETVDSRPEMARRYAGLFGQEYLDALRGADREAVLKEVESLFERAAEVFSEAELPYGENVGKKARSELHEIRHLSVGRQAQEIEAEDQDGVRFKLSDYRGKVVLLYFWSEF